MLAHYQPQAQSRETTSSPLVSLSRSPNERMILLALVFSRTGRNYTEGDINALNEKLTPLELSFDLLVGIPDPETYINKQFRKKSKGLHPDKNQGNLAKQEEFKKLSEAKERAFAFLPEDKTKDAGYSPLVEAIKAIDYSKVERLLTEDKEDSEEEKPKVDPNQRTEFGKIGKRSFSPFPRSTGPVIFLAISLYLNSDAEDNEDREGLLKIIGLLAKHADLYQCWSLGETPLNYVLYFGNVEITQALLESKYDQSTIAPDDSPPILEVPLDKPNAEQLVRILGNDLIDKLETMTQAAERGELKEQQTLLLETIPSIIASAKSELAEILRKISAQTLKKRSDELKHFQKKLYHAANLIRQLRDQNVEASFTAINSAVYLNDVLLVLNLLKNRSGQNEGALLDKSVIEEMGLDQPNAEKIVDVIGRSFISSLEYAMLERKQDGPLHDLMTAMITDAKDELASIIRDIPKQEISQLRNRLNQFRLKIDYSIKLISDENITTNIQLAIASLRFAARLNNVAIIQFLLEHGCDQRMIKDNELPIIQEVKLGQPHAAEAVDILSRDLIKKMNEAAGARELRIEEKKRHQFKAAVLKVSKEAENELKHIKKNIREKGEEIKNFNNILITATSAIQDLTEPNLIKLHKTLEKCNGKPISGFKFIGAFFGLVGILCGIAGIFAPGFFIPAAIFLGIGATFFYHGTKRKMTKAISGLESELRLHL